MTQVADLHPTLKEMGYISSQEYMSPQRLWEQIKKQIYNYAEALPPKYSVGIRFPTISEPLILEAVDCYAPFLMVFSVRTANGQSTKILQHVSQLNLQLESLPFEDASVQKCQPIGFQIYDLNHQK